MDIEGNSKAKLYAKIAAVMGELQRIPKNGYNKEFRYQFATSEDIKDAARQAMAKHNLVLLMSLPEYDIIELTSKSGTIGTKLRGIVQYTLCCGDTGESVTIPMPNEAIDWQDKAFSKLYTIGLKYFLISQFQISTGDEIQDDPDANDKPEQIAGSTQKQAVQPKKQNGKTKPPTSPAELLEVINRRIDVPYDHTLHLFNAIRAESAMDDYQWPKANDEAGWRQAYTYAKDHAAKKTAPPAQDEIPFE